MKMDQIHIKKLEIYAYHGVLEEEARDGQYFYVNADLDVSLKKAGQTDDLTQTINYAEVCHDIKNFLTKNRFDLVESCVEQLATMLLLKYEGQLQQIRLEIEKPSAPIGLPLETVSVEVTRGWHQVFLALGSNMGDKKGYLDFAVEGLQKHPHIKIEKVASYMETEPYGYTDQDTFLNSVVMAKTILDPEDLLDVCQDLEQQAKRVRKIHWGPRTLDVDVLFYDHEEICTPRLNVPHPDWKNRDFVVEPLKEIAPWWVASYRHI